MQFYSTRLRLKEFFRMSLSRKVRSYISTRDTISCYDTQECTRSYCHLPVVHLPVIASVYSARCPIQVNVSFLLIPEHHIIKTMYTLSD